jgi:hypothetical protein
MWKWLQGGSLLILELFMGGLSFRWILREIDIGQAWKNTEIIGHHSTWLHTFPNKCSFV